jgi:hypothetical protein
MIGYGVWPSGRDRSRSAVARSVEATISVKRMLVARILDEGGPAHACGDGPALFDRLDPMTTDSVVVPTTKPKLAFGAKGPGFPSRGPRFRTVGSALALSLGRRVVPAVR